MSASPEQQATLAAADAAARQAFFWSMALASPGRRIGPSIIPCRADRTPVRGWKEDHPAGYEMSPGRLASALRASRSADPDWRACTYSIAPASDGLVVIDVDDMSHLRRVLDVFGPTPVFVRSRSGKVHLYYQGPPVRSKTGLWGPRSIDVKADAAMIHVAGDGAKPQQTLRTSGPAGWLRPHLPQFRVAVYEQILDRQRAARPSRRCPDDAAPRFATSYDQVDRVHRYAERTPNVSEGGRHDATFRLARAVGDLGATEALALETLIEWDLGNEPPQGTAEIRRAVADAYANRHDPVGWRMHDRGDGDEDDGADDALNSRDSIDAAIAALRD